MNSTAYGKLHGMDMKKGRARGAGIMGSRVANVFILL
jgi:hypothetical protein